MAQDQPPTQAFLGEDKFSELPQFIRLEILSLLSRKDATRTGILSTKWKDLWKQRFFHPTVLHFGRAYLNETDQSDIVEEVEQHMSLHRDKKIETFTLYFYPGKKYKENATKWIQQAVVNQVEEFYLDFFQGKWGIHPSGRLTSRTKNFELTIDMFRSNKSLTILSLSYCKLQRSFRFGHFSSLENLYLHAVNLNDSMFEKLITNCRNVKFLELRECMFLRHIKVWPRHLHLSVLTIVHCWHVEEIDISAPKLHSFYFFGRFPSRLLLCDDIPSLRNVIMKSDTEAYELSPWAFMCMELDHVQVLTLCTAGLRFLYGLGNTTYFTCGYIRELQLLIETMTSADLTHIYRFFKQCQLAFLERLFVEFPTSLSDRFMRCSAQMVEEDIPQQCFAHLKIIRMNNFEGSFNEMLLIEFLLRNSNNLGHMILVFSFEYSMHTSYADRQHLCNELMQKPRVSRNAQIIVIDNSDDNQSIRAMHSEIIPRLRPSSLQAFI